MLVLEHRPWVVPAIAVALVIGVVDQTLDAAATLGLGEWFAAGSGILVGACIAYLSALPSRVVFDAALHEVRWRHFGWPGRERGSFALAEITGVEVLSGSSGAERLALATAAGVVPLTRHFSGIDPHSRNADAIRAWLLHYESRPRDA